VSDIAIIGTGIAGLGAAALLHSRHPLTVYEKNDYIGGHTRTRTVRYPGAQHGGDAVLSVDTGFIVFNYRNYPNLAALFKHLDVPVQKSVMSFGVTSPKDDLEWSAENLAALFGQRRNLVRPAFYRFLIDIVTFNRKAKRIVAQQPTLTMKELIACLRLGDWFTRFYILPMGGAIWSCSLAAILDFPAQTFIDFFDAHGLLTVTQQPQWFTVTGGSAEYVSRLIKPFAHNIRTSCGARKITRLNDKIQVTDSTGETREYDHVVLACHGDEALALLAQPTPAEEEALGAFRYQKNIAVLHKYTGIMPRRRACWASWVYHADAAPSDDPIAVTYWMNHLQNIDKNYPLFVTLNPRTPIPEQDIFERHVFTHPIYDEKAVAAQKKLAALQGKNNTWFCGAYHRNGFHEDGLTSAIMMAARLGADVPWR
jgi:predicted NAD/FAD-binding protein